jgi:hypothetical protein
MIDGMAAALSAAGVDVVNNFKAAEGYLCISSMINK